MSLSQQRSLTALLAVVAVTCLIYFNSLNNAYTFDDHPIIEDNPVLAKGDLRSIITSPFWPGQPELGLYRPVTLSSFAINRWILGEDPFGFRVVNVLLHALVAWSLYLVARRFCGYGPALAAALVFSVHPINTEAVNAIVGRAELLAGLFVLLAWYAHHRKDEGLLWRVASLMAYALACLSKEHALVFPSFLVAEDVLFRDGTPGERLADLFGRWQQYVGFAVVGCGALGLRALIVGSVMLPSLPSVVDNPLAHVDALSRILTGLALLPRYLSLVIAPQSLSVDYSYQQIQTVTTLLDGFVVTGVILLAGFQMLIHRSVVGQVDALFGLASVVIVLAWLPISNIAFPIGTPMNERLVYLPMVGVSFLTAALYSYLRDRVRIIPVWVVGAAVIILLGGRTIARNTDWRNDFALFAAAAEASPNSAKAYFNLGNAIRDEGNASGALDAYGRALSIYPAYSEVHYNRGVIYQDQKAYPTALEAYAKVLEHEPDHVNALCNRGILLAREGRADAAVASLERAALLSPARADIFYNLALAQEKRDTKAAIQAYQNALLSLPGYEDAAINLALLYQQAGRIRDAIRVYRDVLSANSGALRAHYNLATELERSGELAGALDAYRESWQAGSEAGTYSRLKMGGVFLKRGQRDSAGVSLLEFKAAWRGDPKYLERADRLLRQTR